MLLLLVHFFGTPYMYFTFDLVHITNANFQNVSQRGLRRDAAREVCRDDPNFVPDRKIELWRAPSTSTGTNQTFKNLR